MVFTCLEKPLHTLLCLSEVPPTLSLKQFLWPSLVLSRKIVWQFLFPCLSPPAEFSSRWYLCVTQKFPQHCLWNSSKVRLIDNGPLLSFQGRLSNASSFHTSLLQVIDGVMPLAFRLQVVSQAPSDLPRHKPLVMAALPSSIYLSIYICLAISLYSGMSRAVHQEEFSEVDTDHWHIPVCSLHSRQTSSHGWQVWAAWKPRCPKTRLILLTLITLPPFSQWETTSLLKELAFSNLYQTP